jgi:hypothetical protein
MKNNKGAAMLYVLFASVILLVLGGSLLAASLGETRYAVHEENKAKAYYIARGGAAAAAEWVADREHTRAQIKTLITNNKNNPNTWTDFADGQFKISFPNDNYLTPQVKSVGKYVNVEQTVSVNLKKIYLFDAAVTVKEMLFFENNSNVYGQVARLPGAEVTAKNNTDPNLHISEPPIMDVDYPYESPPAPPTTKSPIKWGDEQADPKNIYIVPNDKYLDKEFTEPVEIVNGTLNIDIGNSGDIKYLQLHEFTANNVTINVTGNGKLFLYVDNIDFYGNLYSQDTVQTMLVINDEGALNFQTGSSVFQASIYGLNADMTIKANFASVGAIVARNLNIESGGNITYDSKYGMIEPEDIGYDSFGYHKVSWTD